MVEIIVENPYTFDNSPFFYVRMKSTSLFLVTTLRLNRSYEAQLMWRFYNKGKNGRNRLRLMSVFNVYNHVYCETWFKFFLPLRQFIAWSRRKKDSNSKSSPSLNTISLLIMQLSMLCPREGGGGGLRDRVGTIPWDKICIRKLSDQNRERTQPKLFPHW